MVLSVLRPGTAFLITRAELVDLSPVLKGLEVYSVPVLPLGFLLLVAGAREWHITLEDIDITS